MTEIREWLAKFTVGTYADVREILDKTEKRSAVILRLTVQNVNSREIGDVEINASPDHTVGMLLSMLPGVHGEDACFVGAAMLDPRMRLAGSPLVPGAVLSIGGAGPDFQPVRRSAAGTLHVISGPDAGFGVALRPGRYFVGRATESHVCLNNEDVSRVHALVEVSADGAALIADAGSRNGTWVNGARVTGPTAIDEGSALWIGQDGLRWTPAVHQAVRVVQTADGRLEFDPVFAPVPSIGVREVEVAPVEGLWRRKRRRAAAAAAAGERLAVVAAEEASVRRLLAPGPAEVIAMATGARPGLWPRNGRAAHGLVLRVGLADQAPSVRLRGAPGDGIELPDLRAVPLTVDLRATGVLAVIGDGEPARALLRWLMVQLATLRSPDDLRLVLLTGDEAEDEVTGDTRADGETRVDRDGDGDAGDDDDDGDQDDAAEADIRWARWLPHLDGEGASEAPCLIGNTGASRAARIGELRQLITARMAARDAPPAPPGAGFRGDIVVVIDGARTGPDLPGIGDIVRRGPEAGVYTVLAGRAEATEGLAACVVGADGLRLSRAQDSEPTAGTADGVDRARAELVARALSPMRDRSPAAATAVPYPVRLLGLLGTGLPGAADILALWSGKRKGPDTRVVLGADASGPVAVDLATQGPHLLVGGAAGAGGSTLLQGLVTALLLANRPDELNLMLADFGGGTLAPFVNCPHVTGPAGRADEAGVTLTAADAGLLLAAVRAEARHREAILAGYGGEIDNYWRARELQPALPLLPRLVLVADGLDRVLAASPDFLPDLVNAAAAGRSLGVHLVLATRSRPGRPLNDAGLMNHIGVRISLRQDRPAASVELVGTPDAAAIPRARPGRGIIVAPGEPCAPRPFQSGYLGDRPLPGRRRRLAVRPLEWPGLGAPRSSGPSAGGDRPTEQALVIAAIEEAARHIRVTAPLSGRRSWPPAGDGGA
jgi:S-DNA-T family DNA segregation ATPase FtsK/SpoIIIE